jgi:hypothetical protein
MRKAKIAVGAVVTLIAVSVDSAVWWGAIGPFLAALRAKGPAGALVSSLLSSHLVMLAIAVAAIFLGWKAYTEKEHPAPPPSLAPPVPIHNENKIENKQDIKIEPHFHMPPSSPVLLPPIIPPVLERADPKSNLVFNKNWSIGPLYIIADEWSRTAITGGWERPEQYKAICVEVKNAKKENASVGEVQNIKAELTIGYDEFTPLGWVNQRYNRVSFKFGDVHHLVLAVLMPNGNHPADWRIPINYRDYNFAEGRPSINFDRTLRGFAENVPVRIDLLHETSGTILCSLKGRFTWRDLTAQPRFDFEV